MSNTKDGQRFSKMHKKMFDKLNDYIDVHKYLEAKYLKGQKKALQRYYSDVYRWMKGRLIPGGGIPDHYFLISEIEYSGLREIDSKGIMLEDDIPYKWPYSEHRCDLSKKEFIQECEKNLREVFGKYFIAQSDLETAATDIANAGFSVLSEKEQSDISDFCKRNNLFGFSAWAVAVLYAQDGHLPKEVLSHPLPNVYMDSKEKIEKQSSLRQRCMGAKRLVIINYAGTSLFASQQISTIYDPLWAQFINSMYNGNVEMDIVLTDPKSSAAIDALKYKMKPISLNKKNESRLIQCNIDKIWDTMKTYLSICNIHLRKTDIALPCAYFKCEFEDETKDNIKIDIYLPSFTGYKDDGKGQMIADFPEQTDGKLRQSFVIWKRECPDLYKIFSDNMELIFQNSTPIHLCEQEFK